MTKKSFEEDVKFIQSWGDHVAVGDDHSPRGRRPPLTVSTINITASATQNICDHIYLSPCDGCDG